MFNVCPHCGMYAADKHIVPSGPYAVCPHCGYRHPFRQLPLYVISGASGAGKTSVCLELASQMAGCICLENDIFWGTVPYHAEDNGQSYREFTLRTAKTIGQSGWPVAIFGTALPEHFESCIERRYFTTVHYLALVCDDDALEQRLRSRPTWRSSAQSEFVAEMLRFNSWLREHAHNTHPMIDLLDTTHLSVAESVKRVKAWLESRLPHARVEE